MSDAFLAAGTPRRSILPLTMVLQKVQPARAAATPLHAPLFASALAARAPAAALPVLNEGITVFDATATGVTPSDVLAAFYYGGCIHAARRDWRSAASSFLSAIAAPTGTASAIAVAAYKKWVLVSLAAGEGGSLSLPRYVSPCVSRAVRADAAPYRDLASTVSRGGRAAAEVAAKAAPTLKADGNWGLARAALTAVDCASLEGLGRVYAALPLAHVLRAARAAATRARGGDSGTGATTYRDDDELMLLDVVPPPLPAAAGGERRTAAVRARDRAAARPPAPPPPPPMPPLPTGAAAEDVAEAALLAAVVGGGSTGARLDGVARVVTYADTASSPSRRAAVAANRLRALLPAVGDAAAALRAATANASRVAAERRAAAAERRPASGSRDGGETMAVAAG